MPYYTEADRKKAAAVRQRNRMFKQLRESPEDVYDIFGISVPKVSEKPQLADYGLQADIEEELARQDSESVSEKKARNNLVMMAILAVFIACIGWYISASRDIGAGISIFFGLGFFVILPIWLGLGEPKPEETPLHKTYNEYKQQLRYYEYWQRKKNKAHWNGMSGHAFEAAVANLFRQIGFTAEISRRGGDGGVDIVLMKSGRKIAVQCKRYKKPVGPHVIRDLWGTMHYLGFNEGCIVTTTGFTKGVRAFAQDKRIFLIDLNDILKATSDQEGVLLARKIGETAPNVSLTTGV